MVVILELGDKAKPLADQVSLPALDLVAFQRDADAINVLRKRGVLTPYQATKARFKLMTQIELAVKHQAHGTTPRFHPKVQSVGRGTQT